MYFDKELHRGYNVYIDAAADDLGTRMDVGVLVMEPGDTYAICDGEKETAVLLFEGAAELTYGEKTVLIERPDCFRHEAYCLLAPRRTKISLIAKSHAELFIQQILLRFSEGDLPVCDPGFLVHHFLIAGERRKGCELGRTVMQTHMRASGRLVVRERDDIGVDDAGIGSVGHKPS